MVPAGWVVKEWGPKHAVTADAVIQAVAFLLFPMAGRRAGLVGMISCLSLLGIAQTPVFPVNNVLRRDWLPKGPERAMALQIMRVGGSTTGILAKWLVPRLMLMRWGWETVPYIFGAVSGLFAIVWHAFAADKPHATLLEASGETIDAGAEKKAEQEKESFNWSVFKVRGVLACMAVRLPFR